jgi:hypothetical protein
MKLYKFQWNLMCGLPEERVTLYREKPVPAVGAATERKKFLFLNLFKHFQNLYLSL